MHPRRTELLLPLLLALLAAAPAFATTLDPNMFNAFGEATANTMPVTVSVKPFALTTVKGDEGAARIPAFMNITLNDGVSLVRVHASLSNIQQLQQYFDRLIVYLELVELQVTRTSETTSKVIDSQSSEVNQRPGELNPYDIYRSTLLTKLESLYTQVYGDALGIRVAEHLLNQLANATLTLTLDNGTTLFTISDPRLAEALVAPTRAQGLTVRLNRYVTIDNAIIYSVYVTAGDAVIVDTYSGLPVHFTLVANDTTKTINATNYTLTLSAYDATGAWLFNITWRVEVHQLPQSVNGIYATFNATETLTAILYNVTTSQRILSTLGFDKAGFWKPSDDFIVERSYAYSDGTVLIDALVFYQVSGGVLAEQVPVQLDIRVTSET